MFEHPSTLLTTPLESPAKPLYFSYGDTPFLSYFSKIHSEESFSCHFFQVIVLEVVLTAGHLAGGVVIAYYADDPWFDDERTSNDEVRRIGNAMVASAVSSYLLSIVLYNYSIIFL